jgi:protein TonB
MKMQRVRHSVFGISILLHLTILIPFMEMNRNEKMDSEPCITFSIKTAVAQQQEQPCPAKKPLTEKVKKPETVPVKKKTAKTQKKQLPAPVPPEPSSPGDTPPLTRQEPAAVSSPVLPLQDTPAPQSGKYLSIVRTRIETKKHYPPFARNLQHEGTVIVNVTIGSGGAIISAGIVKSSGYASLDKAALEAVRKAGPFPSPTSFGLGQISVTVPLAFKLI